MPGLPGDVWINTVNRAADGIASEVVALGATVGLNFQVGQLPVSTRFKYFHEFDTTNRLQGDAGIFTVSMPLWVPQHPVQ